MPVKNKCIIVTGSDIGIGIGENIAKRLAAEGASILVNNIILKNTYLSTIHATLVFCSKSSESFINIASTAADSPCSGLSWYKDAKDLKGAVIANSNSDSNSNAAQHLARDKANFMTAVCIHVDGARCV